MNLKPRCQKPSCERLANLLEFHQRIKALSEAWNNSAGSHSDDLLDELDEILAEFDKSQQARK